MTRKRETRGSRQSTRASENILRRDNSEDKAPRRGTQQNGLQQGRPAINGHAADLAAAISPALIGALNGRINEVIKEVAEATKKIVEVSKQEAASLNDRITELIEENNELRAERDDLIEADNPRLEALARIGEALGAEDWDGAKAELEATLSGQAIQDFRCAVQRGRLWRAKVPA